MGQMKTQCSKSWTDVNIDFKSRLLRHCCKSQPYYFPDKLSVDFVDNSLQIQERRRQTAHGIQHHDCNSCWRDINSGNAAYKDWMNKWDDHEFETKNLHKPHINCIDIELDNTCDLSCLYCSSICSSKMAQEEGKVHVDDTRKEDIAVFMQWFEALAANSTDTVTVNFLGGEPTASKLFYELVDFINATILKYPNFNVCIGVCTNCNSKTFLMDKLLSAMDNSTATWVVSISNESYGDDSELIRYGLEWDRFVSNFKRYTEHTKVSTIILAPTVNAFSLPSFAQYISFVHVMLEGKKTTWGWVGSHVTSPTELDVKHLPYEYRQYIVNAQLALAVAQNNSRFSNYEQFNKFLDLMLLRIGSEFNPNYKQQLQQFIDEKQRIKQTDKLNTLMRLF
jgi:hypothetical protein